MRETILLVDDEEYIRDLVTAILKVEGFQVISAAGGSEAIDKVAQYDGHIHLLLTDVVMSPMGGGELARMLLPMRPEMRVLYVSGYANDTTVSYGVSQAAVAFLAKPFTPKALVQKIREVLAQPHPVKSA